MPSFRPNFQFRNTNILDLLKIKIKDIAHPNMTSSSSSSSFNSSTYKDKNLTIQMNKWRTGTARLWSEHWQPFVIKITNGQLRTFQKYRKINGTYGYVYRYVCVLHRSTCSTATDSICQRLTCWPEYNCTTSRTTYTRTSVACSRSLTPAASRWPSEEITSSSHAISGQVDFTLCLLEAHASLTSICCCQRATSRQQVVQQIRIKNRRPRTNAHHPHMSLLHSLLWESFSNKLNEWVYFAHLQLWR